MRLSGWCEQFNIAFELVALIGGADSDPSQYRDGSGFHGGHADKSFGFRIARRSGSLHGAKKRLSCGSHSLNATRQSFGSGRFRLVRLRRREMFSCAPKSGRIYGSL